MVRTSLLCCSAMLAASLALSEIGAAIATPIAQPGLAARIGADAPALQRVDYETRKLPFCHGLDRRYHYAWNPGRYDSWEGYGPYKHKHYGGQRWHDLNYNGCAPWWQPEAYGTTKARRAFKQAADNPHVVWCFNRYRSYDPSTDSYTTYDGRQKRCVSPK